MGNEIIDYDLAENEFFGVFLWLRELIYTISPGNKRSHLEFWQLSFDQIAFLCEADKYTFKIAGFDKKDNEDKWTEILRQPLDNRKEEYFFSQSDSTLGYTFGDENSKLETYLLPGHRTMLTYENIVSPEIRINVHWFIRGKLSNSKFQNLAQLLKNISSIYNSANLGPTGKALREIGDTDIYKNYNSKRIIDPELFVDDITKMLLHYMRLRLYLLLEKEDPQNMIPPVSPLKIFILKAFYSGEEELPSFGYYFDKEQITNLNKNHVTDAIIERLQTSKTMSPGTGVCGRVAKTLSFQYVRDWTKSTEHSDIDMDILAAPKVTYKAELKFLRKEKQLYEWPLMENGRIKFILCLSRPGGSILPPSTILKFQQHFIREFQKINLVINEIEKTVDVSKFLKGEVARIKGIYHHSFQQRFFAPIEILLNEIEHTDGYIRAIKKRVSMFKSTIQAINLEMPQYIESGKFVYVDISKFIINDISTLFDLNKKYLAKHFNNPGYEKINLIIDKKSDELKIKINKDIFEQAILQILTNALEIDVFPLTKVNRSPGSCLIKIIIERIDSKVGKWAKITISNNGNPIIPKILQDLNDTFDKFRSYGLDVLTKYDYKPISSRTGSNSGTGLIFSAAVFSVVKSEERHGFMEVQSDALATSFEIYLPILN